MELKFKSLSIFEFQERFPDSESCLQYLSDKKWSKGFVCKKCGHTRYCSGQLPYQRQCTKCRHNESPTSGTLFHKVKFPLVKAFWIVYYVSTNKKGISSTELSRKLELRQKTCWLFKQKVMRAMRSSGNNRMNGDVDIDEFVVGGQEEGVKGRKNKTKKLVVLAIEKSNKGVRRIYARKIEKSSKKILKDFIESTVSKDSSIRTDAFSSYRSLEKEMPNLKTEKSGKKGRNFWRIHRVIMGFKGWLRGIHGHAQHLQAYLDEYCYRFNRHKMKEGIFENLINRMIVEKPYSYKQIIT